VIANGNYRGHDKQTDDSTKTFSVTVCLLYIEPYQSLVEATIHLNAILSIWLHSSQRFN